MVFKCGAKKNMTQTMAAQVLLAGLLLAGIQPLLLSGSLANAQSLTPEQQKIQNRLYPSTRYVSNLQREINEREALADKNRKAYKSYYQRQNEATAALTASRKTDAFRDAEMKKRQEEKDRNNAFETYFKKKNEAESAMAEEAERQAIKRKMAYKTDAQLNFEASEQLGLRNRQLQQRQQQKQREREVYMKQQQEDARKKALIKQRMSEQ